MVRRSVSPDEKASLEKQYGEWKQRSLHEAGWFPVFNGFKKKALSQLSGNAVRLYVYFGLHGRRESGRSWHTIETIAKFFDKSPRAVNEWIKELVDAGLIARFQNQTFLIPYDAAQKLTVAVAEDPPTEKQTALPRSRIGRMIATSRNGQANPSGRQPDDLLLDDMSLELEDDDDDLE